MSGRTRHPARSALPVKAGVLDQARDAWPGATAIRLSAIISGVAARGAGPTRGRVAPFAEIRLAPMGTPVALDRRLDRATDVGGAATLTVQGRRAHGLHTRGSARQSC